MCNEKNISLDGGEDYEQVFPLSAAQRGIWFSQQLNPNAKASVFKIGEYLEISGTLNVNIFEDAVRQTVSEIEAFQVTFIDSEQGPRQRLGIPPDWHFNVLDFTQTADPHTAVQEWMQSDFDTSNNMQQGPLFSFALIQLTPYQFYFYQCFHHLVCDGYSGHLCAQRVAAIYSALIDGNIPVSANFGTFADALAAENVYATSNQFLRDRKHWMDMLAEAPEPVTLAGQYAPCCEVIRRQTYLPEATTQSLCELANQYQVTIPQLLTTLSAIYLHRMTGQEDLFVGFPMPARMNAILRNTPNMSSNILPLRLTMTGDTTLAACLLQAQRQMRSAMRHQSYRGEALRADMGRMVDRRVLFATTVNIMPFEYDFRFGECGISSVHNLSIGPADDLSITWCERGEAQRLELCLDANAALYSVEILALHLERMSQFFTRMVAYHDAPIAQYPLLLETERNQVLNQFNATQMAVPRSRCMHELVELQATLTPEAVAVMDEAQSLTYQALNTQANQMAHWLVDLGIKPDRYVSIALERHCELVVALLAVLKAGGAYVPLDPSYPEERLQYILEDSAPDILITSESIRQQLGTLPTQLTVIDMDRDAHQWRTRSGDNIPTDALGLTSRNLAYMIYTSGSTGKPKGVMVEHTNLVNLVYWHNQAFDVKAGTCVSSVAGLGFDAAVWEIWPPLSVGGYLTVPSLTISRDPQQLLAWWMTQPIEVGFLSTPIAELAFSHGLTHPTLRKLLVGGDRLTRFPPANASFQLVNNYGPTEATVVATSGVIDVQASSLHIGSPIANTQIYILDAQRELVPFGVMGEIYIGGRGIARGYHHQSDQTEERFLDDPFSDQVGARMYRTGDLGRWLPDGTVEYMGRNDFQIKIRGFRIELGEIEAALHACEGVKEAIVVARDFETLSRSQKTEVSQDADAVSADVPSQAVPNQTISTQTIPTQTIPNKTETRLVAYYTLQADATTTIDALRSQLSAHLPEYMVPSAYVVLDTIPLTPNGKVDRQVLPQPDESAFSHQVYEAPQGRLEQQLADIWQTLLGVAQVGRQDNFFELGGHSLLAVQLASRIRTVFSREMGLPTLFDYPCLYSLAAWIEQSVVIQATLPDIIPLAEGELAPLAYAQKPIWFLSQVDPTSVAAYVIPWRVRLTGTLNIAALQQALDTIVARHEPLRSCVGYDDGKPIQRVHAPTCGFALDQIDMRQADNAGLDKHIPLFIPTFDLTTGPMIQGQLVRLSDDEFLLQIAMHHLMADGWSMGVFTKELSSLYCAFSQGQANPLPTLPCSFGEFAAWQHTHINGERLLAQQAYWREQLKGAPDCLLLPTDRPRPELQDYAGAMMPVKLDASLTHELRRLGQRHGVTLFMTLLTSWSVLMARLSNQDDVVIGTPFAGRNQTAVEDLIGMFVNTQAQRVDLSAQPTTESLLRQVKATTLAAQVNQDVPFDQVVEAVSPARSLSYTPIFQVLFALQNTPEMVFELPGLTLSSLETELTTAQFDLTLSLSEVGDHLEGYLNFATVLFDQATVERYLGYWQQLLQGMVADSSQSVYRLPMMQDAERAQVLYGFNQGQMDFPASDYIHERFEHQVTAHPDAIAVVCDDEPLTYDVLNRQANQLARWLVEQGVKSDSRVAIALPRSCALMVAILATLKAGGAYVPLDPNTPQERLTYILQDSMPEVLITTQTVLPQCGQFPTATRVVLLDSTENPITDNSGIEHPWTSLPTENLGRQSLGLNEHELTVLNNHHLAYIIYTSGSTGKPKGVMVEHGNVLRLMAATQMDYQFNADDVWTLFHSYAFDFSVWEIWGALLSGGRLVIVPQLTARSPETFYQLMCDQGVTVLNQTPSAFRQLITVQDNCAAIHQLRYVIFGGEALELSSLEPWYRNPRNTQTQLVNMYGITETTVHTTYHPLTAEDVHRMGPSPIGRPLADLRLYILDEYRQPVPIGVTGELYIGGAGVARGYFNRPELTAERFWVDPFITEGRAFEGSVADETVLQGTVFNGETSSARMYKSGDLGRWLADGTVEYLGRNDDQVKIRGFRIELGEIEAALQQCHGIREAVVVAQGEQEKRLVAYYTLAAQAAQKDDDISDGTTGGFGVTPEGLKVQLSKQLPLYMVPAAYVALSQIPLTANGKMDRKALPVPDESAFIRQTYEAPQGNIESTLATIWQTLLGVAQVGRHDNFFELGGHSLMAVQLIEQLRQQGYHLAVKALFNQPVLAALATVLSDGPRVTQIEVPANLIPEYCTHITPKMLPLVTLSQSEIDQVTVTVPGGAANVQDIYPLAPLQEGILFHHRLEQTGDPYVTRFIQAFTSQARMEAFTEALQVVINRHDILRTAIVWEGLDAPVQVVWRDAALPVTNLTIESDDVVTTLQQQFDSSHTRMDVRRAPMIEAYQAADPNENRWLLCLLIHHLCNDHTTLELLMAEVQAYLLGETDHWVKPLPFRNFVAQACMGGDRDAQAAYFHGQLSDIDAPSAPFGLLDVQSGGQHIGELHVPVDDGLSQRLRQQARLLSVSTASLFHLAWGLVVRTTTSCDDVVFGTVLFGRMAAGKGADRTLGMFLNTLPLRLSLGDAPVKDVVRDTHIRLAALLEHEHGSLVLAQQCSGVASQTPLFSSLLNYRYQTGTEQLLLEQSQVDIVFSEERTNYPISVSVNDLMGQGFSLDVQVDERIGCERIGMMVTTVLSALVNALESYPATSIQALDLLPTAERQQVLYGLNQTQIAYPEAGLCIHQRFEQQAARQPAAIAVIDAHQQLSYQALNAQANQLAHWLVELGVRPDSRVAVSLERSCELVVALMAILKAGGAYVPLDPGYPQERLIYMLADSAPVALITTQALMARLGDIPATLTLIDIAQPQQPWSGQSAENLDPDRLGLNPHHLAYIIYTSGSTGNPKGVMNAHQGVVNRLSWMATDYDFGPCDVILQKTPFSFDVSVWEFFCPVWAGATLVMAKPEGHKDPVYLRALIEQHQITILHFVPPMLQMFLEGMSVGECSSLRLMFCSGEALPAATVRQTYACLPHIELHNLYGPTEAAVDVTAWACPRDLVGDRVSIGRPVANTQMYVLDAQGEPTPMGVSGELYIGGIQVARGYLNRPELSAERFLADPFAADPHARMYRTGDIGRWLADGRLDYQGRNDDQVKIRGFRIELGEITSALQRCRGVQEAIVVARSLSSVPNTSDKQVASDKQVSSDKQLASDKQLIAYYTQLADAVVNIDDLKAVLLDLLPEHMVPAAYVRIEAMPLTPNGKINRKALPEPDESAFVRQVYEAPQTLLEVLLADMWQVLLNVEQVGRHDNFFELGGHSLLAVQLIERLRQQGYTLPVKTLFDQPSLVTLALTLSETAEQPVFEVPENRIPAHCTTITPAMLPLISMTQAQIETVTARVTGGAANVQDIYPLAPLQEGILYHHLLAEQGDPYLNSVILAFTCEAEASVFVDAFQFVIQRHDILRTAIQWEGLDEPVQVVWREASLPVTTLVIDSEDVAGELQRRFDPTHARIAITQAPLMAVYLAADPVHDRWLLCLLNHHLNSDHTTLELLVNEVYAYLAGKAEQLPAPLPFRNFVAQTRMGVDLAAQTAYFTAQLGDIDIPSAPYDLLDVQGDGGHVVGTHLLVETTLATQLRQHAKRLGVSTASLFHLAWGLVVRATTGRDDVVFGTVLFGRMAGGAGADRVLGMFLNTLPLRLSLGEMTIDAAVQQTHSRLAELLDYEYASLVLAQQCSGVHAQQPLFSSLLNYRHDGGSETLVLTDDQPQMEMVFSREQTNYPISVSVNDHVGQGFSLDLLVDARLNGAQLGEMLIAALVQLTTPFAGDAARPVSSLDVLSDKARHQLLHEFNPPQTDVDLNVCLHHLVEAHAAQSPDTIAVQSASVQTDSVQLSYGELNRQANQLAHYLRCHGVGPEQCVALCFDRSPDLIVAMLAVFKAGGAYVPLDPGYPKERLQSIIEDSNPVVLITDGSLSDNTCFADATACHIIHSVNDRDRWATQPTTSPVVETLTPHNLAYIIYTSGSTGKPKGVMVEHTQLANLVYWHQRAFEVTQGTCASAVAGLGFDASVWEIWPVLCAGGYLTLPTLAVSRDPEQLLNWWLSQPIEVGFLSTPIAELALSRDLSHPTLRQLLVGGDRLNRHPSSALNYTVVNNYGPTETTVVATSGSIDPDDAVLHIGRPIDNIRMYILDQQRQLVPVGVSGELYIGGASVSRGYRNRPDLTEASFFADPFVNQAGARMYRSGDFARWLPDGTIEYQGRQDAQVKIRGFRIELGEIESVLLSCEGIQEAVVVVQNAAQNPRLVAYFTPSESNASAGPVAAEVLKAFLSEHLPDYMLPAAYMALDHLPLTANGKIDRQALPQPAETAFVTCAYEAPEGDLELMLAELWCELLGVVRIGRRDNFFELGGHSLLAVKLITRIRDTLNVDIGLTDLFACPELESLAALAMKQKMTQIDEHELAELARAAGYDASELEAMLAMLSAEDMNT